jgi:PiT family inorganic phosphate transporter
MSHHAQAVFEVHAEGRSGPPADPARNLVGGALRSRDLNRPEIFAALASLSGEPLAEINLPGQVR